MSLFEWLGSGAHQSNDRDRMVTHMRSVPEHMSDTSTARDHQPDWQQHRSKDDHTVDDEPHVGVATSHRVHETHAHLGDEEQQQRMVDALQHLVVHDLSYHRDGNIHCDSRRRDGVEGITGLGCSRNSHGSEPPFRTRLSGKMLEQLLSLSIFSTKLSNPIDVALGDRHFFAASLTAETAKITTTANRVIAAAIAAPKTSISNPFWEKAIADHELFSSQVKSS